MAYFITLLSKKYKPVIAKSDKNFFRASATVKHPDLGESEYEAVQFAKLQMSENIAQTVKSYTERNTETRQIDGVIDYNKLIENMTVFSASVDLADVNTICTKVIYIKKNAKKDFIILDAAMNDLMRPALYGARHKIIPVLKNNKISKKIYEFVGPICESTDKFSTLIKFQVLKEKDLIIMCDVGAYGTSLSSNYNVRPKPIEILIKRSKIVVIKKRQKLSDLI